MPKAIENLNDIVKNKYGKLTVKAYVETVYHGKNREHVYVCDCDCGKKGVKTTRHALLKGDTTSCGCAKKDAGKMRTEDLSNQIFGRWLVLEQAPTRYSKSGKTRSIMWKCKCECGTIKDVGARALKTGMSTSCGCLQKERVSEALTDNLIGKRFCYLEVIERAGSHRNNGCGVSAVWKCRCDCGNEIKAIGFSLKNGDTTSCGCRKSSKYELYTEQYLQSCGYIQNETYFREKTFRGLKGLGNQSLRFDFYVVLHSGEKVLIECQGEQHYKSAEWFGGQEYLERVKVHDTMKKEYARNHNIRLVEVSYKDTQFEDVMNTLKQNCIF